jgi:hypothetical protein
MCPEKAFAGEIQCCCMRAHVPGSVLRLTILADWFSMVPRNQALYTRPVNHGLTKWFGGEGTSGPSLVPLAWGLGLVHRQTNGTFPCLFHSHTRLF